MKRSHLILGGLALVAVPFAMVACSHSDGAVPAGGGKLTVLLTGACLGTLEPCG